MSIDLTKKIEEIKIQRSNALNNKKAMEEALQEIIESDNVNNNFLFSDDFSESEINPGIQDLYKFYLKEKHIEDHTQWQFPVYNTEEDNYTKEGWEEILRRALHSMGDGEGGFYKPDEETSELLDELARDAYTIDITKHSYLFDANIFGEVEEDLANGFSTIKVFYGNTVLPCDSLEFSSPVVNLTYRVTSVEVLPSSGNISLDFSINENGFFVITPTEFPSEFKFAEVNITIETLVNDVSQTFFRTISYGKTIPGTSAQDISIIKSAFAFYVPTPEGEEEFEHSPEPDKIKLTAHKQNIEEGKDGVSWSITEGDVILTNEEGTVVYTESDEVDEVWVLYENMNSNYISIRAEVEGYEGDPIAYETSIIKVYQGVTGIYGFTANLTQEFYTFQAIEDGTVIEDYSNANSFVLVNYGADQLEFQEGSSEPAPGYYTVNLNFIEEKIDIDVEKEGTLAEIKPSNFSANSITIEVNITANGAGNITELTRRIQYHKSKFIPEFYDAKYVNKFEPLDSDKGDYINTSGGLLFEVINTLRIISFSVYSQSSQTANFRIENVGISDTVWEESINLQAGHNRIIPNKELPSGNYKIEQTSSANLWYTNDLSGESYGFDYGSIIISGHEPSTTPSSYYYFYDFLISSESEITTSFIVERDEWSSIEDGRFLFPGDVVPHKGMNYTCKEGHEKTESENPETSSKFGIYSLDGREYDYIYTRNIEQPEVLSTSDDIEAEGWSFDPVPAETGDDPEEILWWSKALKNRNGDYIYAYWTTPLPYEGRKGKVLNLLAEAQEFIENQYGVVEPSEIIIEAEGLNFNLSEYEGGIAWTIEGIEEDGTSHNLTGYINPAGTSSITIPSTIFRSTLLENEVDEIQKIRINASLEVADNITVQDRITFIKKIDVRKIHVQFSESQGGPWADRYKKSDHENGFIRFQLEEDEWTDGFGMGTSENEEEKSLLFIRSIERPTITKNIDDPETSSDWQKTIPDYNGQNLWFSYTEKDGYGARQRRWTRPAKLYMFEAIQEQILGDLNHEFLATEDGEVYDTEYEKESSKNTIRVYHGFNLLNFTESSSPEDGEFTVDYTISPSGSIDIDLNPIIITSPETGEDAYGCYIEPKDFDEDEDEAIITFIITSCVNGQEAVKELSISYRKIKLIKRELIVTPSANNFTLDENESSDPVFITFRIYDESFINIDKDEVDINWITYAVDEDGEEEEISDLLQIDSEIPKQRAFLHYNDMEEEGLVSVRIRAEAEHERFGTIRSNSTYIYISRDGLSNLNASLTVDNYGVQTDYQGENYDLADAGGQVQLFLGNIELNTSLGEITFSVEGSSSITKNGITFSIDNEGVYTLSDVSTNSWVSDSEVFEITATYEQTPTKIRNLIKKYNIYKAKQGKPKYVVPDNSDYFKFDSNLVSHRGLFPIYDYEAEILPEGGKFGGAVTVLDGERLAYELLYPTNKITFRSLIYAPSFSGLSSNDPLIEINNLSLEWNGSSFDLKRGGTLISNINIPTGEWVNFVITVSDEASNNLMVFVKDQLIGTATLNPLIDFDIFEISGYSNEIKYDELLVKPEPVTNTLVETWNDQIEPFVVTPQGGSGKVDTLGGIINYDGTEVNNGHVFFHTFGERGEIIRGRNPKMYVSTGESEYIGEEEEALDLIEEGVYHLPYGSIEVPFGEWLLFYQTDKIKQNPDLDKIYFAKLLISSSSNEKTSFKYYHDKIAQSIVNEDYIIVESNEYSEDDAIIVENELGVHIRIVDYIESDSEGYKINFKDAETPSPVESGLVEEAGGSFNQLIIDDFTYITEQHKNKYIVVTSGDNLNEVRRIINGYDSTIEFEKPLPNQTSPGDTYDIYDENNFYKLTMSEGDVVYKFLDKQGFFFSKIEKISDPEEKIVNLEIFTEGKLLKEAINFSLRDVLQKLSDVLPHEFEEIAKKYGINEVFQNLAVSNLFVDNLLASEAFIKRLVADSAFIKNLETKKIISNIINTSGIEIKEGGIIKDEEENFILRASIEGDQRHAEFKDVLIKQGSIFKGTLDCISESGSLVIKSRPASGEGIISGNTASSANTFWSPAELIEDEGIIDSNSFGSSITGAYAGDGINGAVLRNNARANVDSDSGSIKIKGGAGTKFVTLFGGKSFIVPQGVYRISYSCSFSGSWTRHRHYKNGSRILNNSDTNISGNHNVSPGDVMQFGGINTAWPIFGSKTCSVSITLLTNNTTGLVLRTVGDPQGTITIPSSGMLPNDSQGILYDDWNSTNNSYLKDENFLDDFLNNLENAEYFVDEDQTPKPKFNFKSSYRTGAVEITNKEILSFIKNSNSVIFKWDDGQQTVLKTGYYHSCSFEQIDYVGEQEAIEVTNITPKEGNINIGESDNRFQNIYGNMVHGAVWNDIADLIEVEDDCKLEYGKTYVYENNKHKIADKYAQNGVLGIASDTYGFCLGHKKGRKEVPIAIGGFVLAYCENIYKSGTPLVTSKNGNLIKANLFVRMFIPERIVATFYKAENQKEWNKVKVNGRHWVKII